MRLLSLLLTLILLTGCRAKEEQVKRNNIIFILADDLGYGDLGSYGQSQIYTPRLDSMAAAGIRFTNHYSGSTVCAPSRCVLMTGLDTGNCRIRGNGRVPLQPEDVTLAKLLNRAGYKTGIIGKWALGDIGSTGTPDKQGFDYFYGYLNQTRAHNYYTDYLWENETKILLNNEIEIVQESYAKGLGSYATKKVDYSHDLFTEKALEFIDSNADSTFFLYLPYTIPHANNESHFNNEHGMEVPDYGMYASKDWPEVEQGAAAMITRMDRDIGRILDLLEEKGIAENTIVFFSSDNGPHQEGGHDADFFDSNGPLRGIKRDLYEGGIRVPLIVYWPGTIVPAVSDHPSAFWDFMPTALDLASVYTPENLDGISFMPTIFQYQQPTHQFLYWEFHERGKKQAVRMDKYKAIRFLEEDRVELYDLSTDPGEQLDIAADHPQVLARMVYHMNHTRSPSDEWPLELPVE